VFANRNPLLLFLVLCLVCLPVLAQTANEEIDRLREHLSVPADVSIELADSSALPSARPLKVYLALGLDVGVRGNLVKWIDDWNRKDGRNKGAIEIVPELSEADLILARYTVLDRITDRTETYSATVPGTVYDPGSNKVITRPVPHTYSDSYSVVPVFAYIIAREPKGLRILWRYTDQATLQDTKNSGKLLADDLFVLMKRRPK
jgi:hypothetical protein